MQKELGVEDTFNYKKESTAEALKRLAPNGIDIYYVGMRQLFQGTFTDLGAQDNVGGEVLDAALDATNVFARIVGCGAISQVSRIDPSSKEILTLYQLVAVQPQARGPLWRQESGPTPLRQAIDHSRVHHQQYRTQILQRTSGEGWCLASRWLVQGFAAR